MEGLSNTPVRLTVEVVLDRLVLAIIHAVVNPRLRKRTGIPPRSPVVPVNLHSAVKVATRRECEVFAVFAVFADYVAEMGD